MTSGHKYFAVMSHSYADDPDDPREYWNIFYGDPIARHPTGNAGMIRTPVNGRHGADTICHMLDSARKAGQRDKMLEIKQVLEIR